MERLTFQSPWRGESEWTSDGRVFTSPENLARMKEVLEKTGPVILEHWHFYGSSAPDRLVFDDFSELVEYLKRNAIAGDAIHAWSMRAVCTKENELASGKCPDQQGMVPKKGAY